MDSNIAKLLEQLSGLINVKLEDKKNKKLIPEYSEQVTKSIYEEYILVGPKDKKKISELDVANYLEYYLLLNISDERIKSQHFLKSVMALVNHKLKKNINIWNHFIHTK
jgi:hypothetical protein